MLLEVSSLEEELSLILAAEEPPRSLRKKAHEWRLKRKAEAERMRREYDERNMAGKCNDDFSREPAFMCLNCKYRYEDKCARCNSHVSNYSRSHFGHHLPFCRDHCVFCGASTWNRKVPVILCDSCARYRHKCVSKISS